MKKVIKFLPVMAILVASGLAVATTSKTMAPQYYKVNGTGEWIPLAGSGIVIGTGTGQYSCEPEDADCTAEGLEANGSPIGFQPGVLSLNP